jgi:hypothetical protein
VFAFGFPLIFAFPILAFLLFLFLAGAADTALKDGVGAKQPPVPGQKPNAQKPAFSGLACCTGVVAVPVLWVVGAFAVLLFGRTLNERFRMRYTIALRYALGPEHMRRFSRFLERLDELASTELFEIIWNRNACHHGPAIRLYLEVPLYLTSNLDIYCLKAGNERFYFFPDCVVLRQEEEFYLLSWDKFIVDVNNVDGVFTATDYYFRWAHARVDGGPDRRYKHNYQYKVPYKVQRPFDRYGVISLKLCGISHLILTASKRAVLGLRPAVLALQSRC